jgi:hypothetical protein
VNLDNLSRDDMIVGGLALLLAICLLILPWFDLTVGPFSATFSATSSPDGWLGILAFIAALALVADLAIERFSPQTEVPAIGNRPNTRFVLACVAAFFLVLKFLFHIHFDLFGWGFYVNVILTGALVYFALEARNAAPIATTAPSRRTSTTATRPRPAPGAGSGSEPPSAAQPGTGPGSGSPDPGPTAPREGGGSTPPPGA